MIRFRVLRVYYAVCDVCGTESDMTHHGNEHLKRILAVKGWTWSGSGEMSVRHWCQKCGRDSNWGSKDGDLVEGSLVDT